MTIDAGPLNRCTNVLEAGLKGLSDGNDEELREIYRAACIKEFELILLLSGRLLRRRVSEYFATNGRADNLSLKDVFRYAAKHCLIDLEMCERWMKYHDSDIGRDYNRGRKFDNETLKLLSFVAKDARALAEVIAGAEH